MPTAYCTSDDLMIDSNFPLPSGISKDAYVQRAADEMDAKIGRLYKTPIIFPTAVDKDKYSSTVKLLKWINSAIASARLIMAMSMTGEGSQVHAYAKELLHSAYLTLEEISASQIILEGADKNEFDPAEGNFEGPHGLVLQKDATSAVENFYDMVFNPTTDYGLVVLNTNLFRP